MAWAAVADRHIRASNLSTDSENTIHADDAARQFGFRGGLAPGVVVFGYAIQPALDWYGAEWVKRGTADLKLLLPVYDGDALVVHTESPSPDALRIMVQDEDGCAAVVEAGLRSPETRPPDIHAYPTHPPPDQSARPAPAPELLAAGTLLGTLHDRIDCARSPVFAALSRAYPTPATADAEAHPAVLLELANRVLMRNFRLGPWLHASSTVTNWASVRDGTEVEVRARVADRFERKGHRFVVLDAVIVLAGRVRQHVLHTAIYRPNFVAEG